MKQFFKYFILPAAFITCCFIAKAQVTETDTTVTGLNPDLLNIFNQLLSFQKQYFNNILSLLNLMYCKT